MKKFLIASLLTLVLGLGIISCGQDTSEGQQTLPDVTNLGAGKTTDLGKTVSFLTLATACNGNPITYIYSGVATVGAGYLASRDGQVTSAGVFTAPICGSSLLGSIVTVTGSCNTNGGPRTAVANIAVGTELVTAITIVAADVSVCGAAACRAANPLNVNLPLCSSGNNTIQYYARIDASCGPAYAPRDPATVTPLPAACASTISQ
jgi:hypothetical protein